jgi:translation initiation factor 1
MKKFSSLSDLQSLIKNDETLNPEEKIPLKQDNIPSQNLEAHYSAKGRAGKPVTVIKGFNGTKEELKSLSKLLKNKIGVGGSVKNNEIIIQGKTRDKVTQILEDLGHIVKRIGG